MPTPTTQPCTAAITGLLTRTATPGTPCHTSRGMRFRSAPTVKCFEVPPSTTATRSGPASNRCQAAASAATIASSKALCACGRSSVMRATRPSDS